MCNATKEDGINSIIDLLREEGCSGRLAFLCAATGIAAKAAVREGLKFFKVGSFRRITHEAVLQSLMSCCPHGCQGFTIQRSTFFPLHS